MCLLEVGHLFKWPICVVGSKGCCLFIVFLNPKITVMHWSDPKSYKPCVLIAFPAFLLQEPVIQLLKLLLTRQVPYSDSPACSLSFNAQIMVLAGSCGFFSHASASVGWVLALHHPPLWHIMMRVGNTSVLRGGRPEPECFKAIVTYTYSENHTKRPYVCPRMH